MSRPTLSLIGSDELVTVAGGLDLGKNLASWIRPSDEARQAWELSPEWWAKNGAGVHEVRQSLFHGRVK